MKSFYATIDTNVLISAFIKPNSNPGLIIQYIELGYIIPLIHKDILNEYIDVLTREKFHFDNKKVNTIIHLFKDKGKYIDPTNIEKLIDKDDEIFYAITMEENKNHDAYLVTGNTRHFPPAHQILTPTQAVILVTNLNTK